MSKRSSSGNFETDWSRVRAVRDRNTALAAGHPEATTKHIIRGIVRHELKLLPPKAATCLRVDADILGRFNLQRPDYQTRINALLRSHKEVVA